MTYIPTAYIIVRNLLTNVIKLNTYSVKNCNNGYAEYKDDVDILIRQGKEAIKKAEFKKNTF